MTKRSFEFRKAKWKTVLDESSRFYSLTAEEEVIGKLAEGKLREGGWNGKNCRSTEDGPQSLGELSVRHRVGGDGVNGAGQ